MEPPGFPKSASRANPDPPWVLDDAESRTATEDVQVSLSIGGAPHLPVLLVDFPDYGGNYTDHPPEAFRRLFFDRNHPGAAGSLRDYYLDQSGGLLDISGEVTQWLKMPRPLPEYVGSSFGYQTSGTNDFTLVQDAVKAADPTVDFCRADRNGDNQVDALIVLHAGPGAEETQYGLWSLEWSLPTAFATQDSCLNGVKVPAGGTRVGVKKFVIVPESYQNERYAAPDDPSQMVGIGLLAHELGHVMGLPDLYDTDYSTPGGVATWDVMATGAWGFDGRHPWRPTPLSAWSKMRLGWAVPQPVLRDMPSTPIPAVDRPHTGPFLGMYKLAPGGSQTASEYFLVENREPVGWAADFPEAGLAIWHVDATRPGNSDESRPLVTLVQADGRNTLSGAGGSASGDEGDLFPGSGNVRSLNDSTTPSTRLRSGQTTNIAVEGIGDPGATTVADLFLSPPPQSPPGPPRDLSASPADGRVSLSWQAPDEGVLSYHVYRSSDPFGSFRRIATVDNSEPYYHDGQVVNGQTYYYKTTSYNRLESEPSNEAEATAKKPTAAPGSAIHVPSRLDVTKGEKVSGSPASVAERDDQNVVLRGAKVKGGYVLDYTFTIPLNLEEESPPDELVLNATVPKTVKAQVSVYNNSEARWEAFGKHAMSPESPLTVVLQGAYRYLTSKDAVKVRLKQTRKTRMRHEIDSIQLRQ